MLQIQLSAINWKTLGNSFTISNLILGCSSLLILFACFFFAVLEKSEFKDESQFFRFHADEETEGTSTKTKQLRNDFKLIENIMAKSLVVCLITINTNT